MTVDILNELNFLNINLMTLDILNELIFLSI